jgi:Prokaryotic N-terminal methylation motif
MAVPMLIPTMKRERRHDRHGFTVVEVVVTVTLVALVLGVLIDILIVGMQSPADTHARLAPAEAELAIARFVSKDVLPSLSAAPNGTACGVTGAALVTTEKSVPTVTHADQSVAYSLGPEGLTRSTCAPGATSAATTTVVSTDVTLFVATCRSPGACGTVHIQAATATSDGADHPFVLDVTRKLQK